MDRETAREALAWAAVSYEAGCSADLSLECREAHNIFSFNCCLRRVILRTLSSRQGEFSASAFLLYDLHISILLCIVAGLGSYSSAVVDVVLTLTKNICPGKCAISVHFQQSHLI